MDLGHFFQYHTSRLALNSAIYIDGLLRGEKLVKYNKSVEELEGIFFELSREDMRKLPVRIDLDLSEFYFSKENCKEERPYLPEEDLKGIKIDDLNFHSWLFAKDLSTIDDLSKERQEEIMNECIRLNEILFRSHNYSNRRGGLAA